MGMSWPTLANHFSRQGIQGCKYGAGTMPFIVMRHRAASPGLHWQARLRPIQRLNRTLLIDAEHHRLLWRGSIEPHHIVELCLKSGIGTHLELHRKMRFQPHFPPDSIHEGMVDPEDVG